MAELMSVTTTPVELRNKFSSVYYDVIENNENWFYRNSMIVREFIKPGSTVIPDISTTSPAIDTTDRSDTSAVAKLYSYWVILQIIAFSVSTKVLVSLINQ